ncbi:RHS repeat domain-containing protein [Streptacidiphilus anmyonensis]|uniref:RHS repeat domain-containing protein n=1 Tax=Streptacidiphilus anmyonensis TaxID=405782 RepID=UPI0005A65735|nr:RHS repeat domain-containing protein [Streptacidiphilus anmyonensis]
MNAAGQATAVTEPLGVTTDYTYDLVGHLVRKNAGGRVTSYDYNESGHLVRAENPDAIVVREVDAFGGLLSESVNGPTLTRTRDVLGRRTRSGRGIDPHRHVSMPVRCVAIRWWSWVGGC